MNFDAIKLSFLVLFGAMLDERSDQRKFNSMSNIPKKQAPPKVRQSADDVYREIRSGKGGLLGKKISQAMTSMPKGK